jgi:transcriptional regulator with XRE-family HTH domain
MEKTLSLLRRHRILRGLSMDEVAVKTGINQSWLSKAERGLANLTSEQKETLAEFYGIEPERLFLESDK